MDKHIAKKLINKKLIAVDTEVAVVHTVRDFGDSNMEVTGSFNITGLNENDYIHIELCGFTTDYYKDGKKFQVLQIKKESNINILLIEDHHIFEKKNIKNNGKYITKTNNISG